MRDKTLFLHFILAGPNCFTGAECSSFVGDQSAPVNKLAAFVRRKEGAEMRTFLNAARKAVKYENGIGRVGALVIALVAITVGAGVLFVMLLTDGDDSATTTEAATTTAATTTVADDLNLAARVSALEQKDIGFEARLSAIEAALPVLQARFDELGCACLADAELMAQFVVVVEAAAGTPYEGQAVALSLALDECKRLTVTSSSLVTTTTAAPTTTNGGGGPTTTAVQRKYQCNDGIDNDSDGLVDFGSHRRNDPGCSSPTDDNEFNRVTPSTTTTTTQATTTTAETTTTQPATNEQPVADAGSDATYYVADDGGSVQVALNGSASYDNDGNVVSYNWTGVPDPSNVQGPTLTLGRGVYTFCLVVTDDDGATSTNSACVTITVKRQSGG